MAINEFEYSVFEIEKENRLLKYGIELKDDEISNLKSELSLKDKVIGKLQTEKEKIRQELQSFKGFWYSIINHFHKRICYDKDNNYKIVSGDLYQNGIFDDNDNEIANNICRRVTIPDENKNEKNRKKNNDTRFQYGGNLDMINDMDLTNKLRLAICMSDSSCTNLKYDKPET